MARARAWFATYEVDCLVWLTVVGVLLRLLLAVYSPAPFGYVWDPYLNGIRILFEEGRLPIAADCWQCYHPPLFYVAGWPLYAAGRWLNLGLVEAPAIRWATLLAVISAAVIVWYGYRLLRLAGCRGASLVLGVAMLLTFPCLFISGYGLEADVFLAAILSAFIFYFARDGSRPERMTAAAAVRLGVLAGLAAATKYSGLAALAAAGLFFGWQIAAGPARRIAVRNGLIVLAVCAVLGGWKYVDNARRYGTALFANGPAAQGFSVSERKTYGKLYDFTNLRLGDLYDLLKSDYIAGELTQFPAYRSVPTTLHALAWTDMTFFSVPSRYGDPSRPYTPPKHIPIELTIAMLVLGIVPEVLALIGIVVTLRHRLIRPMTIVVFVSVASYVWWFQTQPAWGLKTKYLLFLVPAFALYAVAGLAWIEKRLPAVVAYAIGAALVVQILIAHVYLYAFAQGRL